MSIYRFAVSLLFGAIIGVVSAQATLNDTPTATNMAYLYAGIAGGVAQIIQISISDKPVRWRKSIGEVLASGFLGYAAAHWGATYYLEGTSATVHSLIIVAGLVGSLGANTIRKLVPLLLARFGLVLPQKPPRQRK